MVKHFHSRVQSLVWKKMEIKLQRWPMSSGIPSLQPLGKIKWNICANSEQPDTKRHERPSLSRVHRDLRSVTFPTGSSSRALRPDHCGNLALKKRTASPLGSLSLAVYQRAVWLGVSPGGAGVPPHAGLRPCPPWPDPSPRSLRMGCCGLGGGPQSPHSL